MIKLIFRIKKRVKIATLCFAIVGCSFSLQSQNFDVGGISYASTGPNTAKVVAGVAEYSGNVDIPDTVSNGGTKYAVTGIDAMAFFYNEDLNTVKIPATVSFIGELAFVGCSSLTAITVADTSTQYLSLNGVLYSKDTTVMLCYPVGKAGTSFLVHDSVRTIDDGAFMMSPSLTTITFSSSSRLKTIGNYAFVECRVLKTVNTNVCDSLISIGDYAFTNCDSLKSLSFKDSLNTIGEYAFAYSGLTSFQVPSAVKSIGNYAFFNCPNLTDITVTSGNTNYKDISGVLFNYNEDTLIAYPAGKIGNTYSIPSGVTTIGCGAFAHSKDLRTVFFSLSVVEIGEMAFSNGGLTSLNLHANVKMIRNNAFFYCDSLSKLTMAEGIDTIGYSAFEGCISLDTVRLPNSLKWLDTAAFYACHSLKYVSISKSMTTIAPSSFSLCNSLTFVDFPASLTLIDNRAFAYCSSLTSLTIPDSVKKIGNSAFTACGNLKSLKLGSQLDTIGGSAFSGTTMLTEIYVNAVSPPKIDTSTFEFVPKGIPVYVLCNSEDAYKTSVWGYAFDSINVKIPLLTVLSNDGNKGSVSIVQQHVCNNLFAKIEATPNAGYGFSHWNDSITDNPRIVYIDKDTSFTAVFINQYIVTLNVNNPTMGSVTGDSTYNEGDTAHIKAVANPGHYFVQWSDGNTNAMRDTVVMQNIVLTATFVQGFTVTLTQNIYGAGSLDGDGGYSNNTQVKITATANSGYRFLRWSDGNGNAIRTFTLVSDTSFQAIFIAVYNLTVTANYPSACLFTGQDVYDDGTTVQISASPMQGYRFIRWMDGVTNNPRTITISSDTTFIAILTNALYVDVLSNDTTMGSVTGGGDYDLNDPAVIQAFAKQGYRFLYWNDSITTNPRNITVTQDSLFTAYFIAQHQLTVLSADIAMGTVTGGGTFDHGSRDTIEAHANTNYRFTQWTDGNTNNPRVITLISDTNFTAEFVAAHTVTVSVNDTSMGTAAGSGTYLDSSRIVLKAIPKPGYRFVQWNITDAATYSDTTNPRNYLVTAPAAIVAQFVKIYRISVTVKDPLTGRVEYDSICDKDIITTLTAVPNYPYRFLLWNDGDTTNPRNITVTQDTSFQAEFIAVHHITVRTSDTARGSVIGSGDYDEGETIQITATAISGFRFARWNDGDTNNPRNIIVTQSKLYTAHFAKIQHLTVLVNNATMGIAIGSGNYDLDSTATVEAIPNAGYKFSKWDDGNTDNPRNLLITNDMSITAIFINLFKVDVFVNDTTMGSVVGGGFYDQDEIAVLTAVPNSGYRFVKWTDEEEQNPRSVEVTENLSFTAVFELKPTDPNAVEDLQNNTLLKIYPNPVENGKLTITNYNRDSHLERSEESIEIFDIYGRKLSTFNFQLSTQEIDVSHLATGTYFIKINNIVRKIIINNK